MSYDMAVWNPDCVINNATPAKIYKEILRNKISSLKPSKNIDLFFEELLEPYPEVQVHGLYSTHLLFATGEKDEIIVSKYLAIKNNIVLYDPQIDKVFSDHSDELTKTALSILSKLKES